MFFSVATLLLSVLAASDSVAAVCQLPFTYSTATFRPVVHQIYGSGNQLLRTIVSNNTITIKKRPSGIPDGQLVRVSFRTQNNWIFTPETVTFVSSGPDTAQVQLYPVQAGASNLSSIQFLSVYANYQLVGGVPCSPAPDPGVFVAPITFSKAA